MTTKLDSPLKREIEVDGRTYTVTLTPHSVRLTQKGRRKGLELVWRDLVSGEEALAVALNASLGRFQVPQDTPQHTVHNVRASARKRK
jgi:hypothetical protein